MESLTYMSISRKKVVFTVTCQKQKWVGRSGFSSSVFFNLNVLCLVVFENVKKSLRYGGV